MRKSFKIDFWLLAPALALVTIGLTTLASINPLYFQTQAINFVIAFILFFILIKVDFHTLKSIQIPMYIASLVLLTVILIIGIESRGAVRWIELFGIRIQFSEVLKPVLSVVLATYISEKKIQGFKSFLFLIFISAPVFILIYFQPDLGSALIYAGVFFLTLIVLGFPIRWFFGILFPLVIASPLLWAILHEYQRQRIITFLNPQNDPMGTSYNSIQALIAVGSGMFFGKGLGESTQSGLRFLPERQTDFIFATLSEGLGFIGSFIVILAFSLLLYRIYVIFTRTEDLFEKTFLICCFFFIFLQFLFNIGMNLGLFPVVGITLPFVSYGGSSLAANFMLLAFVSSISVSLKKRQVLEIR